MWQYPTLSRRGFLIGAGALGFSPLLAAAHQGAARETVSVKEFGAVSAPGRDNTASIQAAVRAMEGRGGGVILIPEIYECGNIVVSRDGIVFFGPGAWLVNARITIMPGCEGCGIEGVGIIDKTGDGTSYLLDISGRNCHFRDVSLVKDPIAGGYQMYLRKDAAHCTFSGLRTKGSNGIFISGHDHLFNGFELESTFDPRAGGDDAFVVKAPGTQTYNITIENGTVRGHSAILSIGSEVGTSQKDSRYSSFVRNVSVRNVVGEKCARLALVKPGALIYDYRNGLVEGISLSNIRLHDPTGYMYLSGIVISVARGAIVRDVVGRDISIHARALSQGVLPTSAIDLNIIDIGAPGAIENVDLQVSFVDPYAGAPHGPATPGFPVDHIVRIEKLNPRHGLMSNIVLDVSGIGSRFGGIYVGAGLDDAVRVKGARLQRVAVDPPSSLGGGGIWSDSRIILENIKVDAVTLDEFGGKALGHRR